MISINGNRDCREHTFKKEELLNNTIEIVFDHVILYCWPGREFILGNEDQNIQISRGYFFPLSFITIICEECGYTLLFKTPITNISFTKIKKK